MGWRIITEFTLEMFQVQTKFTSCTNIKVLRDFGHLGVGLLVLVIVPLYMVRISSEYL